MKRIEKGYATNKALPSSLAETYHNEEKS